MPITQKIIDDVMEIYLNETEDYDEIADRMEITVMDVANIINDAIRTQS